MNAQLAAKHLAAQKRIAILQLVALTEPMAHRGHNCSSKSALLPCSHIHGFWIAALLVALIDLPNVGGWMGRIAAGVERGKRRWAIQASKRPTALA